MQCTKKYFFSIPEGKVCQKHEHFEDKKVDQVYYTGIQNSNPASST